MATLNTTAKSTKRRFTAPFIESVKAPADKPQQDYFDTVLPAFGLRVGKRRKSYFVMVRTLREGKWKVTRTTLGTTDEMNLSEARESAREAITRARQGKAPVEVKRERREARKAESRNSFSNVLADFLRLYRTRQKKKPSARTLDELKRVLESDLFKDWNYKPLSAITRRNVMDLTDTLMSQGKETAANRYLVYLKMFFGWALDRDIIETDPTARVKKPGAEKSRERVLDLDEMRAIWKATEPTLANRGDLFAAIVRVLMLTGQRRSEVAGTRWSEIDLSTGLWHLPAERTKNSRDHLVPLSDPILEILHNRQVEQREMGMDTPFVFTSTGQAPFSGWSKSKARLDSRADAGPWTLHDLRRTLVTRMAEDLHIQPHVVEAAVNHVSGFKAGVAGTYNRALYLVERKAALAAWADYLLRIVGESETDNVVEIGEARQ